MEDHTQRVTVIGAGTMGAGIAQVCAQADVHVQLIDQAPAALDAATSRIRASLDRRVAKGKLAGAARDEILRRVQTSTDIGQAVDADWVIEAVPERIELKLEIFRQLDRVAKKRPVLATNTSSLSVTEIAGACADPSRAVGLHFFNPVPAMKLVEIVEGLATSAATVERARAFVARLGKEAIVVRDAPGFATSRLGVALGCEAIRMLESGVASAEDIDKAMELGYRHPMGPLKLTDLVGLDVRLAILEHLHRELGEAFRPPPLLRQMVRAGRLGRKTGRGFYTYPAPDRSA